VKIVKWDEEKNKKLKVDPNRQVSFDDVLVAINEDNFYKIEEHYNQTEYSHQYILYIEIRNYIYIVPFIETDEEIFLKTIIPSRRYTKIFLKNKTEK
jgi:hypothetical protein